MMRTQTEENTLYKTIEEKIVKVNGEIGHLTYKRGQVLGKGGFATVYELLSLETNQGNAVKVISKELLTKPSIRTKLMNEIKIHRSLHHEHIVQFERYFEDSKYVYMILEFCSNSTLFEVLRRRKLLTELEVRCYLHQLVQGVAYLHSRCIVHRDLKLSNILLNRKMQVKIADFGLATKFEFSGDKRRTICGTPNYIAPEVLDGLEGYGLEVDVWSLGVLTYTLAFGKPPFEAQETKGIYSKILQNDYKFPEKPKISDDLKDLISRIFVTDPSARISLNQILEHDFFLTPFPKSLPISALVVAPSSAFVKEFCGKETRGKNANRVQLEVPKSPVKLNYPGLCDPGIVVPLSSDLTPITDRRVANVSKYTPQRQAIGLQIWVRKWVNHLSKYGLGYLLSNNSIGIHFNDSTKMISNPSYSHIKYITENKPESAEIYSTGNIPDSLKKKFFLLEQFRKHLLPAPVAGQEEHFVYVEKWFSMPRAFMFKLSSREFHIYFEDKTEIIINNAASEVAYVNQKEDINYYPLELKLQCKCESISRRIQYTREVLKGKMKAP